MKEKMKENTDLSIIIPIYNHEKYIKKCLDSILKDFPENAEIIIIDDGSTDNSVKIIEEFNNNKIRVFKNKKNMGCAYSLNKAILLSKGQYIGTMNSDDFVEKGFYRKLLSVAKKENADVVCANIADYIDSSTEIIYNKINENNLYIDVENTINISDDPFEVKAELLLGHWTASSASTKIIKKELLYMYPYIGSKANDITTIYPIMACCKKIFYIPNLYMFYRQVPNSLSRRNTLQEYNSVIESIVETMKRLENIDQAKEKVELLFFNNSLSYFINVLCRISDMDTRFVATKFFLKNLKEYNKKIFMKMKQSKYYKPALKRYQISKKTYDLLENEKNIDFMIEYKAGFLEKKNEILISEIDNLNKINENLTKQILDIKMSRSWRITKPIRKLKIILKKYLERSE